MISEGGKQLLLLPARDAARRFVPRRVKVQAREVDWHPVVLRWRKRGKHLTHVIVRRVAGQTKLVSFPQFHFHFATHQTQQSSTNISRVRTSSTRVFDARIVHDEGRASVHPASPSQQHFGNPSVRATSRAPQSMPALRRLETPVLSTSKSTSAYPVAPPLLHLRKHLFSRRSTSAVRPFTTKEDPVPPRSQSRIFQYWTPSFAPRSRNQSSAPVESARESTVLSQYHRTEELVWRRVSKTTTDITERVRHLESIVSSEQSSSRSASNQQSAVAVAGAMEAVAAMPVTKLDPALMDRLANDVIRRVEQRVRIERERRGL